MTNGMDMFQSACSCRGDGGGDLIPLLVAAAVIAGVYFAGRWFKARKGKVGMTNGRNVAIIAIVLVAVAAVVLLKQNKKSTAAPPAAGNALAPVAGSSSTGEPTQATQGKALPRLVDLGAGKCIPCKMMAPILEDLKKTSVGKLDVQFIDVWENPDAGRPYRINVIPTQIFYDAAGKELFRHEGFFGKEDILAKWREFGVDLSS